MGFDSLTAKRHSARAFTSRKVDWRDIIKAVDCAIQAPSAGNIQALRFILVSDKEKIKRLAEAAQQDFIAQAQHVVAVCSEIKQVEKLYDERAEMYLRQQAGAAIEHFLLKITELGMASCWIGAFADELVKSILEIPGDSDVEALLPVGYELGKARRRPKASLDSVLYFEKYKNRYMK